MYGDKWRIGALARVYAETNGGVGETLLHLRLSLLLINIDCDCILLKEHYCIASLDKKKIVLVINSYNKNFSEKNFHGLALSTKYFNSELFPNYGICMQYT